MGGSACLTIGGGVVSDLFKAEQRGLAMSVFSFGPLFGPVLGPICGGFIAQGAGWRWVFWVLVIVGGTFTAFVIVFNRETNPVILMEHKTQRLREELGRPELRSCYEKEESSKANKAGFLLSRLSTPLQLLFRSPIISIVALYIAIVYGCLYLLFTTVTDVFQTTYHWSVSVSGLSYIGLGLGFITGQTFLGFTSDKVMMRLKARKNDIFEPEMRLLICIPFAFFRAHLILLVRLVCPGPHTLDCTNHWPVPIWSGHDRHFCGTADLCH
ncbi:hypothetical protein N7526_010028 [Penicillium atrosanguineum]|nr:hypothetical protein N7526_010028 [Penicillium atrosanguineum]